MTHLSNPGAIAARAFAAACVALLLRVTPVPEPAGSVLALAGLATLWLRRFFTTVAGPGAPDRG